MQGQRTHSVRPHGTRTNKEKTAKGDHICRKDEISLNSVAEYYTERGFKNNFNISPKNFITKDKN